MKSIFKKPFHLHLHLSGERFLSEAKDEQDDGIQVAARGGGVRAPGGLLQLVAAAGDGEAGGGVALHAGPARRPVRLQIFYQRRMGFRRNEQIFRE